MHKEEGRKDVIDVLKKLWLVYKLREPVMHVCIWHQYSLTSEFLKVPNMYLIYRGFRKFVHQFCI
jgi:hypothetical protein